MAAPLNTTSTIQDGIISGSLSTPVKLDAIRLHEAPSADWLMMAGRAPLPAAPDATPHGGDGGGDDLPLNNEADGELTPPTPPATWSPPALLATPL